MASVILGRDAALMLAGPLEDLPGFKVAWINEIQRWPNKGVNCAPASRPNVSHLAGKLADDKGDWLFKIKDIVAMAAEADVADLITGGETIIGYDLLDDDPV